MSQTNKWQDVFSKNSTAKHSLGSSQLPETKKKQERQIMCDVNVINANVISWIQKKISWRWSARTQSWITQETFITFGVLLKIRILIINLFSCEVMPIVWILLDWVNSMNRIVQIYFSNLILTVFQFKHSYHKQYSCVGVYREIYPWKQNILSFCFVFCNLWHHLSLKINFQLDKVFILQKHGIKIVVAEWKATYLILVHNKLTYYEARKHFQLFYPLWTS